MKKITTLFVSVFAFCFNQSNAQQWDSIANFNSYITCLKTFNNKLFIGGDFTKCNNASNTCYSSANYDGSVITPHTTMITGTGIDDMEPFGGELYSADGHAYIFQGEGISKWDGTTWLFGGSIKNSNYLDLYADGNDLWASAASGDLFKKTGTGVFQNFYSFPASSGGNIYDMIRFQGKLIVCGSFDSIGSIAANNIAQWNGSTWESLGTGTNFASRTLAIYNNNLYVGGSFTTAGGTNAFGIAKWNGTSWTSVGGSITGTSLNGIRDLKTTSTGLVVVGQFDQIGGVNTKDVAKWNGTSWVSMNLSHNDMFVSSVEEYNGKIYVGTQNAFFPNPSHLYVFNSTTEITETNIGNKIQVIPNPIINSVHINWSINDINQITLLNAFGQIVSINEVVGNSFSLDMNSLPSGMYLLNFKGKSTNYSKQISKQ